MKKRRPKLNTDYVIKFLNAIGDEKVGFLQKQEVLLNNFSFRTFSMEWEKFRMVVGVEVGKIKKIVSVKRTSGLNDSNDCWDQSCLGSREKNPWDLCSCAAKSKINDCLRDDDGILIKVEKKFIITYNGVRAGRLLDRGKLKLSKSNQLSFPKDAIKFHETVNSANLAAEKLRDYIHAYQDKKRKKKK